MIATSPRSGSTLLALVLWRSGVLGAPMEYLNFENCGDIVKRLGNGDIIRYWHEVRRHRASPNGVFGYKMFLGNYKKTLKVYPELVPFLSADRVIFLKRSDKVSQAVSYLRAIQSGAWFAGVPVDKRKEQYIFDDLLRCFKATINQDLGWEHIFATTEVSPLRLTYEEFDNDLYIALDRVSHFLEVDVSSEAAMSHIPLTEKQSDGVSEEWSKQFIVDARHRGVILDCYNGMAEAVPNR